YQHPYLTCLQFLFIYIFYDKNDMIIISAKAKERKQIMNEQTKQVFETEWGGRPLIIEYGEMAKQASGSVLVRYGDTVVLSTATGSKEPKNIGFFPLTVAYEEKMYAAGKIPGGFNKREGRPSEDATLDRKSTRLNSSHVSISYAVFCL